MSLTVTTRDSLGTGHNDNDRRPQNARAPAITVPLGEQTSGWPLTGGRGGRLRNEPVPGRVTTSRSVNAFLLSGQAPAPRTAVFVDRADVLLECGQVERVSGDHNHVGALAGG